MPTPRCVLALLCGTLLCAPAAAQAGDLERLSELFAAARYDAALEQAAQLEDRVLAAEWASYIHSAAGDLTGSLRAARAGLELEPGRRGLLVNALNASLTLGLADTSLELAERLEAASLGTESAELERAERLSRLARELADLDALGAQRAVRARWTALLGLTGLLVLIALLARTPRARAA